jgi:hypothetical protein
MNSITFGFFVLSLSLSVVGTSRFQTEMQERQHTDEGPYTIAVEEKIDSRHARVHTIDTNGIPKSDSWKLAVCPNEMTPSFDAGCLYEIAYQLTSTELGICESFTGKNAKAKEISCQ